MQYTWIEKQTVRNFLDRKYVRAVDGEKRLVNPRGFQFNYYQSMSNPDHIMVVFKYKQKWLFSGKESKSVKRFDLSEYENSDAYIADLESQIDSFDGKRSKK